ncbi:MAG: MerC domain-containing protein [Armatimonadota bacterium]
MRIGNPCSCLDPIGIVGAVGCALHCAALPLLAAILPVETHWMDNAFPVLSCLVGLLAFADGLRRHRRPGPAVVFAVGMALVLAGRSMETRTTTGASVTLMVVGGLVVAVSHAANHRLRRTASRMRHLDTKSRPA